MKRLVLLLASCLGLSGCDVDLEPVAPRTLAASQTETRDSIVTLIRPVAPFAADLPQLGLSLPAYGTKVSGPVSFAFDTAGSPQGILLLFDRDPGGLVAGRLAVDWKSSGCIGGIASMAGMRWNGSATLDSEAWAKGFHACGSSEHEPVDPVRPLTTASLKDGAKVWWVVIGYDALLRPVAASPVYFFTWSRNP